MKRLLLTTCIAILFVSCMTEKKAVNYLTDHGKLPAICATAFPSIDSVGDLFFLPDSSSPINIDHTADLSTLELRGDSLLALLAEKRKEASAISNDCADVVLSFMRQVDSLQRSIKTLRNAYKPPKSDTVTGILPHYNLNPPELAACQIALNDQKSMADKATTERDVYKQLFYYALAIVIGLIIIFSLIVFLKFVKK